MSTTIVCPICFNEELALWSVVHDEEYHTLPETFSYYECNKCSLLQIHPVPDDRLDIIYPHNYYSFQEQKQSVVTTIKEWLDKRIFKRILKGLPGNELKVLDVGGGSGWLLNLIRDLDKRVTYTQVVDLDSKAEALATENGHHYFHGPIERYETDAKFDFILMLNLIEHVKDPLTILIKLREMLSPSGVILLKTPNYLSLDARLFKDKYWGGLHAPRHWVVFSENSFRILAAKADLLCHCLYYTQGAPFWATAVLARLHKKGMINLSAQRPAYTQKIFPLLLGVFSGLDFLRKTLGAKTSQMFIVLGQKG